jgi:glutaredoxin-related protein
MKEMTKVHEIIQNLAQFGDFEYLDPLDNPDDWKEVLKYKAWDYLPGNYEDSKGAEILADMVDTAIDWENWPNPTF